MGPEARDPQSALRKRHSAGRAGVERALLQSNLDWFNLYIWGDPIPKDSPLYGTSELEGGK